ncbi:hypothetical protein AB0B66_18790 [Catellatospora sp. NPDC049111]|uniref:hypothetical protein n=1 Tax=Catellatospora sp. NPDC049111 TaxID=3155271 RepID=UPI0033F53C8A
MTDEKQASAPAPVPMVSDVVRGRFIGPVQTVFTPQPDFIAFCTDWNSYDVPRMWDSVRNEDDPEAWKQMLGWERLGQLLADHHDRLATLRNELVEVWDPQRSKSAGMFMQVLDRLIYVMRENAYSSASTARGLDGVLQALKAAKEKVGPLKEKWDNVTTDWVPEWWDGAADELNNEARQTMTQAESAVEDYRRRIVIPEKYDFGDDRDRLGDPTPVPDTTGTGGTGGRGPSRPSGVSTAPVNPPPPVPGYDPVLIPGPDLQGMPQPVPAVPGSPISVLPVPPGSPYAPNGGAYILPGPGVGRGGWIAPMPMPAGVGGTNSATGAAAGARAGGMGAAAGMMPFATPAGAPGQQGRGGQRDGRRDEIWKVAKGVPPVIEGTPGRSRTVDADAVTDGPPLAAQDAAFADWFAKVATPWSDGLKVSITRRSDQPT